MTRELAVMNLAAKARRGLQHLARLGRRGVRGEGGVVLQPYRGYGSREEVFLIGRVFREPGRAPASGDTVAANLARLGQIVLRRGIGAAPLVARFAGAEARVLTDADGYFRLHLRPATPPRNDRLWHEVELELLGPERVLAKGELFVPPRGCRYVVISDIDDTIMASEVASLPRMLWRLFLEGADQRIAFPGMAALLRAFHAGPAGEAFNPLLYVSRSPWSNYEVLDAFFKLHRIPVGPLLFLREWGLTLQSPLPRRAKGHKLEMIRNMLDLYRDLPFVLIGDSGQRDPEVYARIVRERPGRVLAIYIRNVSREPERQAAIEALAAEVAAAGSSLLLATDSLAMAEHAIEHGLIVEAALAGIAAERAEAGIPVSVETRTVTRGSPEATRAAVERGRVAEALEEGSGSGPPPNVVVEPEDSRKL
jgi:phosphatidate phosphatase APP1